GDQERSDRGLRGRVELGVGQGQARAQGRVGVVTEALGIRHGDQKEVEGAGLVAELIDIALTDQALIHPAELLRDVSELGRRNGAFVHPGYLRGDGVDHTEYRAPIVAAGGRWWRCHLVT